MKDKEAVYHLQRVIRTVGSFTRREALERILKHLLDETVDAALALEIQEAHSEGADMDAGFDGGEFSGPAHSRMEEQEIKTLAEESGFTYDEVMAAIMDRINRAELDSMSEPGQNLGANRG